MFWLDCVMLFIKSTGKNINFTGKTQGIKRPARDTCLCMGELPAPPAPLAPHFVFLITL